MRARIITICVILTIFVVILKAFDSIIDTYHKNFGSYLNSISSLNPLNLMNTHVVLNEHQATKDTQK
jgi:hypothetical protein